MNIHTKRFIASALIYFFIGCLLGLFSALNPALIPMLKPVHAHINLLGWVSMMIIGVSYFVIPLFTRKTFFSDKLITIHFLLAHLGLLGMVFSSLTDHSLFSFFVLIETLAAYFFLLNIMLTVIKGKMLRTFPDEGKFLLGKNIKSVDLWAAKFTIASTLYFVAGSTIGALIAFFPSRSDFVTVHYHLNLVGWISMMIYGVGYHIFPRFSHQMVLKESLVKLNFFTVNVGIILMTIAMIYGEKSDSSEIWQDLFILASMIEGIAGIMFVVNILPCVVGGFNQMGKSSLMFVRASLTYLVVGIVVGLYIVFEPDYDIILFPIHVHLNVLGWITMMIFGVGYYIIPAFMGKKIYSEALAKIHFWIANLGLIGFLGSYLLVGEINKVVIFFTIFEMLAAIIFIFNIAKSFSLR